MFTCKNCSLKFVDPNHLIMHIRKNCATRENNLEFHCGETGCHRHFTALQSFRKHLLKKHVGESRPHENVVNQLDFSIPSTSTASSLPSLPNARQLGDSPQLQIILLISTLYSLLNVPKNLIQLIVDELVKVLAVSKNYIFQTFNDILLDKGIAVSPEASDALERVLANFSNSLSSFNTEHKRFKYFKKAGTLIDPLQTVIGQRTEYQRSLIGQIMVSSPCTMQIIPIHHVLTKFLSMKGLLKEVLKHLDQLQNMTNSIENIVQGRVWKNRMASKSGLHLPLIIFYDDFEIGNPLGSHATVHKLGGVYLSMPFLPGRYVSQLNHIFMLALFHASDRTSFGNRVIFQQVIQQLNFLSNTGIYIENESYTGFIKFCVACVTGDNLGLNGILGFVESFVANHCCRICLVNKQQLQTMCVLENSLLRSDENYHEALMIKDVSKTGIKEKCVFVDDLEGFKLFENVSVDILHDYFEGVCRYVMTFVINHLVFDSNLLPLNILTSRLAAFDYGPDSNSKPTNCVVIDNARIKLRTSAAEMMILVRYFGVLVGYYLSSENEVWELFLLLRKVMDRLINPRVYEDTTLQLQYLIENLCQTYLDLTKSHLTPKFHFLLHYPDMMLKFGPLNQIWTMRFEAKHRVSKIAARVSCNKINICKTIAMKNQLVLNNLFLKQQLPETFVHSKCTKISSNLVSTITQQFGEQELELFSVKSIKITGFQLLVSSIVTTDINVETFTPIFAEITKIVIAKDKNVFLLLNLFETIDFDQHYYAYNVNKTSESVWWKSTSLFSLMSNTLTVMNDLKMYITVRMPLD